MRGSYMRLQLAEGRLFTETEIAALADNTPLALAEVRECLRSLAADTPQIRQISLRPDGDPLYFCLASAVLGTDLDERLRRSIPAKLRSAYYVVQNYIRSGTSVALDAGSGAFYVALELLRHEVHNLTVVTNNVAALSYLKNIPGRAGRTVLIGGPYNVEQGALVASVPASSDLLAMPCELAVIGINAFDAESGRLCVSKPDQKNVKSALIGATNGKILFLLNHPQPLYDRERDRATVANLRTDENRDRFCLVIGADVTGAISDDLATAYVIKTTALQGGTVSEIRAYP